MARYNGSVTRNSRYYSCYIIAEESEVSITNNTSKVTVYFHIVRNKWGWQTSSSQGGSIVIDGTKYNFSYTPNWSAGSSGDVIIASASKIITHNDDGSRECAVSATWNTSGTYSCGTASASGTLGLTKISRFAEILTAPNFTDEDNPTITYKNPAGNSVDLLQACIAEPSGSRSIIVQYRNIPKTGTEYTFTLTDTERLALRNYTATSASKEVGFYVRSVIGTGDSRPQLTRTLTIINANPIFSDFSVQDNNDSTYALTGDRSKFIKKYSNALATISTANKMTALKQATPDKYLLTNGDKAPVSVAYSNTNDVSGVINNIDTALFSVSAVDSRGLQTTITKTLDMLDYSDPLIQTFNIHRVDGAGTKAVFSLKGTYSNINFGAVTNTITAMKIRYKKTNATTYSDWFDITALLQLNQGIFSVDNATINNISFELGSEFDIQIIIIDKLSEFVQQGNIDDGTVLMAALKGHGVAFGGVYDKDLNGAVQVYGDFLLDGKSLKAEVLFESGAGETSSVSLSKSSEEFAVFDIYYINFDGYYSSVRVENPNGKSIQMNTCSPNTGLNGTYFRTATATITGANITLTNQMQSWIQNTSATAAALSSAIKIVKVVGYYDMLAINYTQTKIDSSNLGKYMQLVKSTQQIIQPATTYEMKWETTYADTTDGLLIKSNNKIKIGKNVNNVYVHAQWRDNSESGNTFAYIMKNGERYSVNLYNAQMIVISEIVPVTEGDEIHIETYQQGTSATTIPGDTAPAWEYFKIVILN